LRKGPTEATEDEYGKTMSLSLLRQVSSVALSCIRINPWGSAGNYGILYTYALVEALSNVSVKKRVEETPTTTTNWLCRYESRKSLKRTNLKSTGFGFGST